MNARSFRISVKLVNFQLSDQEKRDKIQINSVRNARADNIADSIDIKSRIRDYPKEFHPNKFNSLGEMDEFLEKYQL